MKEEKMDAKHLPHIAEYRAKLAALYRAWRKENPKIARLIFKRIRNASEEIRGQAGRNMIEG